MIAVLAGGRGRRMGGAKAVADFGGRPLIAWPLAAAAEAGLPAVVVAKPSTALPELDVPVWHEPPEPVHPLLGIVTALERAGEPIVAVGCDMPFVPPEVLAALDDGAYGGVSAGPLPARYEPAALPALRDALARSASLRSTVTGPLLDVPDDLVASINTPAELRA